MPFYIPISVKIAITAGALVGGTVALVNNKGKMLEVAEQILQAGANFCKEQQEKLKEANMSFADGYADQSFYEANRGTTSGFSSGVTTPESSDDEYDEGDDEETTKNGDYYDLD